MKTDRQPFQHAIDRQKPAIQSRLTRRQFVRSTAGITAGVTFGLLSSKTLGARRNNRLPTPQRSGIEHVVLVMMENRSFDHFLGWVPGADGQQAGLTYLDRSGQPHATSSLAPDYQGCSHPDPDHSYDGGRIAYNNGACDGWLRAGENDVYAIGYYTQHDLPLYAGLVQHWLTCDRYFAAIMAPSYPNR